MITKLINNIRRKIAYCMLPKELKDIFCNIDELLIEVESSTKQVATYRFATRVAHDIRSPLAVLNSVAEQYKQSGQLDVETITLVCRRISKIANDLMNCDTARDQNHSIILPYLVLREVVNEKQYLAQKTSCHLSFSCADDMRWVCCQASHVEFSRVLSNVINNAMEAVREAGTVCVDMTIDADRVVLSVKDNGVGMPEPVKQDVLAGRAVSTKVRGAGIGLRSAIDTVQSLLGSVVIDSQLGQGTTVTLRLPYRDAPPWFVNTLVLDEEDSILVVDDESRVYTEWQQKLKTVAVNMHHISGNEKSVKAFDYIRESRYDLYFLEHQNPHLIKDGVEMIEEYGLTEKALVVTSHYDDALLQQVCSSDNIKLLPKGLIRDLRVVPLNKTADVYLIDDDALFAKAFYRTVDLQGKTMQAFSDLFNLKRCLPFLNKAATFYVDLTIETERDGLQVVDWLSRQGISAIYILSGEHELTKNEVPSVVKAVYNKAEFDWSAIL